MIEAKPDGWFSMEYVLWEHERPVATIKLRHWREAGEVRLKDTSYEIYRQSLLGPFVLAHDDAVICKGTKRSFFRRVFTIEHGGDTYWLDPQAVLRRGYDVIDPDGQRLGSIEPAGLLTRNAVIDLPHELPLELQAFMAWIVFIMWRRARAAAGGS